MFGFILKKLQYQKIKSQNANKDDDNKTKKEGHANYTEVLSENVSNIKSALGNSNDLVIRQFSFGHKQCINAAIVFIDGMTNTIIINQDIIEPLIYGTKTESLKLPLDNSKIVGMLSVSDVQNANTLEKIIEGFLSGDAVLMIDGMNEALIISCKGWEKRSISEPATESVIRGPREGFTENLRTNTAMLRRKIKNPELTMEMFNLGKKTNTNITIAYIRGIANQELIEEVRCRINGINTDSILESGYIEQFIEDAPVSIFSTMGYTEKPDVVAARLIEGRIAILIDGTPFVLTVPMFFIESFQTAEDYYSRPYFMSMLRIIRFISFIITILAPAVYVAITTYHQELIPTKLLFTMAAAREGVPLPAAFEAGLMIVVFEILREAGVRLPRPVGQAISIVGALVMGESAVSAGLIGEPMVIVIAITAVALFVVPNQADAAAILRLIYLVLSAVMGGMGITVGLLATLIHLAALKSFGYYYISPIAPFQLSDTKDSLIRAPLWSMRTRPSGLARNDKVRQASSVQNSKKSDERNNKH